MGKKHASTVRAAKRAAAQLAQQLVVEKAAVTVDKPALDNISHFVWMAAKTVVSGLAATARTVVQKVRTGCANLVSAIGRLYLSTLAPSPAPGCASAGSDGAGQCTGAPAPAAAEPPHPALLQLFVQQNGAEPRCVSVEASTTLGGLYAQLGIDNEDVRLVQKGGTDVTVTENALVDVLRPGATLEVLARTVGGGRKRERKDGDGEATGRGGRMRKAKDAVSTTITGLGRSHLGPAGEDNKQLRKRCCWSWSITLRSGACSSTPQPCTSGCRRTGSRASPRSTPPSFEHGTGL